jgi:hypothetical protein
MAMLLGEEIPRTKRSGFRLQAPASLTPAKRLKLSAAGPIVLHAKVVGEWVVAGINKGHVQK